MKNGVRILATNFRVDKEAREVECELLCDMQLYKRKCYDALYQLAFKSPIGDESFFVRAKAKCHPTDKFDETVGKRISESRAKAKMLRISAREYGQYADKFYEFFSECSRFHRNCKAEENSEYRHINKLVDQ